MESEDLERSGENGLNRRAWKDVAVNLKVKKRHRSATISLRAALFKAVLTVCISPCIFMAFISYFLQGFKT
jgi:hypothetical protein